MKTGKFYPLVLVLLTLLLVVLAACGGGGDNSDSSQNTEPTNTPRTRNTAVPRGNDNTQDPLDDSTENTLPNNTPANQGGTDQLDDSPANSNNPNTKTSNPPPENVPPSNEGMVSLPDTAWLQMESDEQYKFCADNKWQVSNKGGTVTGTGTFEQQGATVVLSGDGDPRMYALTWDPAARVLAMKAADTTFNLAYKGASGCP